MNTTSITRDLLPDPPWNRINQETDPAYQAFTTYRDMSYKRSLAKVGQTLGKSKTLIDRWSACYLWRFRVEEWDQDQETVKAVALNTSIVEMAERQAAQAVTAVDGLMLPHLALAQALGDADLVDMFAGKDPDDLLKLAQSTAQSITVLMQAERLARGEPSDIVRTQGEMTVGVEISDAEVEATTRILADAGYFDSHQTDDGDVDEAGTDAPETSETVATSNTPADK